jgi:putative ABC transport system ATP-binding protein
MSAIALPLDDAPLVPSQSGPLVTASGLVRRFGVGSSAVDALRGVTLDVEAGRMTAIMGPSGSGKSTLMHLLAGLDTPTEGSIVLDGVEITGLSDKRLTQLRRDTIGFVFQFFNLLPMLTAEENITLPLSIAGRKVDPEWLDTLLDEIGIDDRRDHRPSELSGGQQQRVAVARALVTKPKVIFADEPTGNLDSSSSKGVLSLMRRAVDEWGQTIVMVTHDAGAAALADRILFIADGRIVRDLEESTAAEVLAAMQEVSSR